MGHVCSVMCGPDLCLQLFLLPWAQGTLLCSACLQRQTLLSWEEISFPHLHPTDCEEMGLGRKDGISSTWSHCWNMFVFSLFLSLQSSSLLKLVRESIHQNNTWSRGLGWHNSTKPHTNQGSWHQPRPTAFVLWGDWRDAVIS